MPSGVPEYPAIFRRKRICVRGCLISMAQILFRCPVVSTVLAFFLACQKPVFPGFAALLALFGRGEGAEKTVCNLGTGTLDNRDVFRPIEAILSDTVPLFPDFSGLLRDKKIILKP